MRYLLIAALVLACHQKQVTKPGDDWTAWASCPAGMPEYMICYKNKDGAIASYKGCNSPNRWCEGETTEICTPAACEDIHVTKDDGTPDLLHEVQLND